MNSIKKISNGVKKSVIEGKCIKNKIPLNEYEIIKSLYLSNEMNQRKLAIKYKVTPASIFKLLKRLGVKK